MFSLHIVVEEEFEASPLPNKMVVDTTSATVARALAESLEKHEPFTSEADRERMRQRQ